MDKRSIDEQITDRLSGMTIMPSDAVWQKVGERLDKRKKRRVFLFWWLPTILISAGSSLLFLNKAPMQMSKNNMTSRQALGQKPIQKHSLPEKGILLNSDAPNAFNDKTEILSGSPIYQSDEVSILEEPLKTEINFATVAVEMHEGKTEEKQVLTPASISNTISTNMTEASKHSPIESDSTIVHLHVKTKWKFRTGMHVGSLRGGSSVSADAVRANYSPAAIPTVAAPAPVENKNINILAGLHLYAEKPIAKQLTFSTGMGISLNNVNFNTFRYRFTMVDIPAMFQYTLKPSSRIPISISAGLGYTGVLSHNTSASNVNYNPSLPADINKNQWQYRAGLHTVINKNGKHPVTLGLTEQVGINPLWINVQAGNQKSNFTRFEISWGWGTK